MTRSSRGGGQDDIIPILDFQTYLSFHFLSVSYILTWSWDCLNLTDLFGSAPDRYYITSHTLHTFIKPCDQHNNFCFPLSPPKSHFSFSCNFAIKIQFSPKVLFRFASALTLLTGLSLIQNKCTHRSPKRVFSSSREKGLTHKHNPVLANIPVPLVLNY